MRLARALDIASIVHDEGVRKGADIPYIQHPWPSRKSSKATATG